MSDTHKYLAIFDWNGTLLNDAEHVLAAQNQTMAFLNKPAITMEEMRSVEHIPLLHYYHHFGVDTDTFLACYNEVLEQFGVGYKEATDNLGFHLRSGAIDLLSHLKSCGVTLAIISNRQQDRLLQDIQHFGLEGYFDAISGVADKAEIASGLSKTRRLGEMLAEFDVPSQNCMIIGDTQEESHAASHHGAIGVAILGGVGGEALLAKAHPSIVVNELFELPEKLAAHWPFLQQDATLRHG